MGKNSLGRKSTACLKIFASIGAAAFTVAIISGCDARPGAAVYNKDFTITEKEISQVTDELKPILGDFNRDAVLTFMVRLRTGTEKLIEQCPDFKAAINLMELEKTPQVSKSTQDVLRLSFCDYAINPQIEDQLSARGIKIPPAQVAAEMQKAYLQAATDPSLKFSPRYPKGMGIQ